MESDRNFFDTSDSHRYVDMLFSYQHRCLRMHFFKHTDVRFPLIHYPPSLQDYVKTLKPAKKVILVLTKTDLVPRWLAQAWKVWFEESEGPDGASVVLMESYRETERNVLTQGK